ncbi:hypothetical protein D9758_015594 [Tetrapyrgos nigripes]|uniref:Uncharacterized protein n=1 Tax=Tetrapyrgos nigripes TaxID=182062 RepID=A0A8H5CDD1_9AGAR|nr:hypothetical protein D9758_015594 [Tetrapyrgos nigripes]
MELFHQAQNVSISDSNIIVQNYGTIVRKKYTGKRTAEDDNEWEELDTGSREKRLRLRSILEDFEEYRRGDMLILHSISNAIEDSKDRYHTGTAQGRRNRGLKIQVIRLASRKVSDRKFMAISYEGKSAAKKWFRDLQRFSQIRISYKETQYIPNAYAWQLVIDDKLKSAWLAQATYIFEQMGVGPSGYEDFYFVEQITCYFSLRRDYSQETVYLLPQDNVFLFLPPPQQVQGVTQPTFFTQQQSPYWSLMTWVLKEFHVELGNFLGFLNLEVAVNVEQCVFQTTLVLSHLGLPEESWS